MKTIRKHKPLRPSKRLPNRSPSHTYIVAYKIHAMNELAREISVSAPAEKPIDVALDDMAGLNVLGSVWVVEIPGYSSKNLRDLLREYLLDGDELFVAPLTLPDRVTGVEIESALEILSEWSSAVNEGV